MAKTYIRQRDLGSLHRDARRARRRRRGGQLRSLALPAIDLDGFGNAITFGGILGFAAVIFGWLGGLLSPGVTAVAVTEAPQVVERPRRFWHPWMGRRSAGRTPGGPGGAPQRLTVTGASQPG